MSDKTIMPPDLDDVLGELKREIFANLNCIQIGKIEKFDKAAQSAEVQIQVRRRLPGGKTVQYPLLVDCPVLVLQGGGSYVDMPIAAGDYCLVLFNDRDIDNWWTAAQSTAPNTRRKHALSDGFVFVGVNPKTQVRDIDGNRLRLVSDDDVSIEGVNVDLNGNSKRFVTHADLNTALQAMVTMINAHTHVSVTSLATPTPPTPPITLDISASQTTTIRTGG